MTLRFITLGVLLLAPLHFTHAMAIKSSPSASTPMFHSPITEAIWAPLTMSIYELSLAMNGSGKAKRIWKDLRSGIDPLDSTLSSLRGTRAIETLRKLNSEYSILDSSLLSTTLNHNDITLSSCGTQKMLLSLKDGYKIESVLIPSYKFDRTTLCISTQIGCDRGCRFCATGKMGLIRNLQGHEIVSQVVQALKVVNDDPLMPPLLNVVFMGMGDAGQNIHEVSKQHKDKQTRKQADRQRTNRRTNRRNRRNSQTDKLTDQLTDRLTCVTGTRLEKNNIRWATDL